MTSLAEAISDADTQEPAKPNDHTVQILDSDDDSFFALSKVKPKKKPNNKIKRMMERIIDDSDHSDEEQQVDQPVDFGEEEEEEEGGPQDLAIVKNNKPSTKKSKTGSTSSKAEPDNHEKENAGSDNEDNSVVLSKDKRLLKSATEAKKSKTKKEKDASPSKTIRKNRTETKSKLKTVKGKQASIKKVGQKGKSTSSNSIPDNSPKANQKTSPPVSPRISPVLSKKEIAKSNRSKTASTTDNKSAEKVESNIRPKEKKSSALHAKKSIEKGDTARERKKSPVKKSAKSTPPVNTYSKKAKKASIDPSKSLLKTKEAVKGVKDKKSTGKFEKQSKNIVKKKGKSTGVKESKINDVMMNSDDDAMPYNAEPVSEDEIVPAVGFKGASMGNLACSTRDKSVQELLEHAVRQFGRYDIITYDAESNADLRGYIIGKDTKRGWGILQALVSGIPLISEDWISASISQGSWAPMDEFLSDKFGKPASATSGKGVQSDKILEGVRVRVVSNAKDVLSVRKVLRLCGARLAETRVDVVINDSKKQVESCANVHKKWLADSIEAGMALDYDAYLIDSE